MDSFHIKTFGCKLNQADSAAIRGALIANNLFESPDPEHADLILVNTCTVTSRADQDVRKQIRKLRKLAPESTLIVTGCYAERDAQVLALMPEVDQVFGLTRKEELHQFVTGIAPENHDFDGITVKSDFGEKSRAFLKIQDGCDMKCSFCIVRIVRGKSRSLMLDEILTRLRMLAGQGFREVVLTGVNLGLWGKDFGMRSRNESLLHLLTSIDEAEDMPTRIRINSLDPVMVSDELLQMLAESRRFAHHLHLSVQSGAPDILKAMRRHTDVAHMHRITNKARELMPECGIGADVIVGFPGETDDDFQQTCDLLTSAPFTYGHIFSFSPRPGTDAAELPHPVNSKVIRQRSARLRAAMSKKNISFRKSFIGKTLTAIPLHQVDEKNRRLVLTGNYLHVSVDGLSEKDNQLLPITVTGVSDTTTSGVFTG
jgi:threonylcarbamoyladenosine tRNA methylthiotransferase MtaB